MDPVTVIIVDRAECGGNVGKIEIGDGPCQADRYIALVPEQACKTIATLIFGRVQAVDIFRR
jgi:hypothetical protein